ncbi:MAG TPA: type II secretion system protein [Candidatus Paceibacterota bacterium]
MRTRRGFTLIELMVAVGIFSIIMLLASSAYLALLAANRNERSSTEAVNNLTAAIDAMARDIRTGSCGSNQCVPGTNTTFTFTSADGCAVTYRLGDNATLQRVNCDGSTDTLTDSAAVTLSHLAFDTFLKQVQNPSSGTTGEQLWTTILVTGATQATAENPQKTFHIETGATMRSISIL